MGFGVWSVEAYNEATKTLHEIVARVAAAGEEIQEWWTVRTEAEARHPLAAPKDRIKLIENWAGPREFATALQTWDVARVAMGDAWKQMGEIDRTLADPPWDPFGDD